MEREMRATCDVSEAASATDQAYRYGMRKIEIEFFRAGPADRATITGPESRVRQLLDDWGYGKAEGWQWIQEADEPVLHMFEIPDA